jgi:ribosomal protein L37E
MNRLARTDASPTHAVHFCTHCGTLTHEATERVCGACGLGVVLSCAPGVLPRSSAAFVIVRSDLRISAASAAVEPLLGDPDALVGRPLLDVLSGDPGLARWLARAAMGSQRVTSVALRLGTRRINGRIAACGHPRAALLVLV